MVTLLYCFVHLLQIQQTICGTHFINFAVDAWRNHLRFSGETEVLQPVDFLLGLGVVHHHRPSLKGIIHFRRMETQGR